MATLVTSISDNHTTSTITDTTVYSSPARSALGVFVSVFKVDFRGTESWIDSPGNNADPETNTTWSFPFGQDGHFRYKYIAVPDYSGAVAYTIYDAVFNPVTNEVHRSKTNGNLNNPTSNPTYWEIVPFPANLADNKGKITETLNCVTLVGNYIIYVLTQDKRDLASIDGSMEQDLDAERNKDIDKFRLLDIFVEGLKEANSSGKFNQGERIARRASAI